MEHQQPKTGKFALTYGILLGAIGIVYSLMKYFMDMQYQQNTSDTVISIVLLVGIIALGIYQYKRANEGFLKLSQAIKVGLGVALIGALISVVYLILYTSVIDPEFIAKSGEVAKTAMQEKNPEMTPDELNNAMEMRAKFFWIAYPVIIIFNLLIGLGVSLIAGLIMRKSPSAY